MYKAIDIAMYIIDKCTNEGIPVSNLQLQKILYYIQVNFLRIQDKIAFQDFIEAWQHGPVIPNVYNAFNNYGGTKIYRLYPDKIKMFNSSLDKEIIDKVITICRNLEPWDLVQKSHKKGGPWDQVYHGFPTVIPVSIIRDYAKGN